MPNLIELQTNFTAGELSPRLQARSDFGKYANGVARLRNFLIWKHGGISRRTGTRFVAACRHHTRQCRLIPFQFNTDQAYILEFGHQYMRVYMDRGQLYEGAAPYQIATPYSEEDLDRLSFVQTADVMYFAHPEHHPQKLSRYAHLDWRLEEPVFTDDPFTGPATYPTAVTFYEQRLVFAGSRDEPQTLWFSRTADYENFNSVGDEADDSITFTIAADEVNAIQWLSPGRELLIGTSGGEWVLRSNSPNDGLTPDTISARRHSRYGSAPTVPVVAGHPVLFVQRSGRRLRELIYSFENDGYVAEDMTLLAEHIARDGLKELAWQQEPDTIIWCRTAVGGLLGFTYDRAQKVIGWHPHRIGGTVREGNATTPAQVESLAVIPAPDGTIDDLWLVVKRSIDGQIRRYVEHLETPFTPADDYDKQGLFFVDCGLSGDLRNRDTNLALTLSTPNPDWQRDATLTLGASRLPSGADAAVLGDEAIGDQLRLDHRTIGTDGTPRQERITVEVLAKISDWALSVRALDEVPESLRNQPTTDWARTTTRISGLEHLEGETVAVLADHAVHPDAVVSGGAVTLQFPASEVQAGFAYASEIETLDYGPRDAAGPTRGRRMRVEEVDIDFMQSQGGEIGMPDGTLDPLPIRSRDDAMDAGPPLMTGIRSLPFPGGYTHHARIVVRQALPLPLTIRSITARLSSRS